MNVKQTYRQQVIQEKAKKEKTMELYMSMFETTNEPFFLA